MATPRASSLLSREDVLRSLAAHPSWTLSSDGKSLRAEFVMRDFLAAVALIETVARAAERRDHHPDVHLTGYRRLAFELSTHSAGGITDKDFALAGEIDRLPKSLKS